MPKILLVDDNDLSRAATRRLLECVGCEVQEAGDAAGALELVAEDDFDLLMTDILMPDMDGIELIRELYRTDRRPKIIAISGGFSAIGGKDRVLRWARALGADTVLSKPFGIEEIRWTVEKTLAAAPVSLLGVPPGTDLPGTSLKASI